MANPLNRQLADQSKDGAALIALTVVSHSSGRHGKLRGSGGRRLYTRALRAFALCSHVRRSWLRVGRVAIFGGERVRELDR